MRVLGKHLQVNNEAVQMKEKNELSNTADNQSNSVLSITYYKRDTLISWMYPNTE